MPTPAHAKPWFLTGLACVLLAVGFGFFGHRLFSTYVPEIDNKGWAAIAGAAIFLIVKYSDAASHSKQYKPHEQGYDASIMAAGAVIPGAAAALVKKTDPLMWVIFAFGGLVAIIVSSAMSRCADECPFNADGSPSRSRTNWTIANYLLGTIMFLFYVFFLVLKAQP